MIISHFLNMVFSYLINKYFSFLDDISLKKLYVFYLVNFNFVIIYYTL